MTGFFIEIILACKAFAAVVSVIMLIVMMVIGIISSFK